MLFTLTLLLVVHAIAAAAWVGLALRAQNQASLAADIANGPSWLQGVPNGNAAEATAQRAA